MNPWLESDAHLVLALHVQERLKAVQLRVSLYRNRTVTTVVGTTDWALARGP